ncbi:hypothetical protein B0H10DRAFT_1939813 [Mycena sp. CBHHK59/15]|nr:hypothetical protein B0H10DRAFT_1939813 [Mycena sp. CBHHK59/15]
MSLPSDVRCNPSRSTCIPRRPDSPVSYALPPSTERNQSLSESDHGPNSETVNNTGIDPDQTNIHADLVNDAPAGIEAASLNKAAESVMNPGKLYTAHLFISLRFGTLPVQMLSTLAEFTPIMVVRIPLYIHWRLGLTVFIGVTGENMVHGALLSDGDDDSDGASLPDLDSVDSSEGSYQQRADELVAQISRLQGHYALPVEHAQPSVGGQAPVESEALVSVSFTALQGQPKCLYFVGIQNLSTCRSFCQLRDFVDVAAQDGAIFLRLQTAGGLDYTNHQYNFREIGSLLDLENLHSRENIFEPIPASPARSALLETQRVAASTPVFVLYVYHQDAEPYSDHLRHQSTAGTTLLPQSPVTVASASAVPLSTIAPPALIPVAPPAVVASQNPATEYLLQRFSVQYADLATWRARTYGSAYIHCLTEHQILGICQSLNIGLLGHTNRPAIIGSMTIRLEDVVSAAGINFTTFSTMHTEFCMVKEAHVILRRLARAGTLPGVYRPLLDFVEAMMSERVLGDDSTWIMHNSEATSEVEFTVVRCTISSLMTQIRAVIDNLANI